MVPKSNHVKTTYSYVPNSLSFIISGKYSFLSEKRSVLQTTYTVIRFPQLKGGKGKN